MKMKTFKRNCLPHVMVLGLVSLTQACGETVNFDTQEKLTTAAEVARAEAAPGPSAPEGTGGGDAISNPEGSTVTDEMVNGSDPNAMAPVIGSDGIPLACHSDKVIVQNETLSFPEIPAGTTCKFGTGENLSRVNGKIRAYLKQSQEIALPEGATLCGFSVDHDSSAMRYDDEMFFSVNNRLLLSTQDYSEYLPETNGFYSFAWNGLVDKVYDPSSGRGVYCAGGAQGLSSCSVPPTETDGQIKLEFSDTMKANLARSLQSDRKLTFDWITTGDNDDSDCRHTAINLKLNVRYVTP
ncbi:MAG: hypothetical protein V4655_03630 [Bdellovibrionota bacterium]